VGFGRIYETRGGPDNSAPVLVNNRQRPDAALRSGGDPGGGKRNPFNRIAIFSKNLFGRMILSEKSATFRAHA
jgi:hypothetical protein